VTSLEERGRALEDAFFREQDEKNMEALRLKLDASESREQLRIESGIKDDVALDQLVKLGVTKKSLAAMSMVPLLRVAWADGKMDNNERDALLQAAQAKGIAPTSATGKLLAGWLTTKPDESLYQAWHAYIQVLIAPMAPAQREALKEHLVDFARLVAEAAGGFLGLATVSKAEEEALAAIGAAFE